jgi:hypothetical protein
LTDNKEKTPMPPLRDFDCLKCMASFEDVLFSQGEPTKCPLCGGVDGLQMKFSYPSNYTIGGDNSASIRPKRMGGEKE